MSGPALAKFSCGAADCREALVVPLINDGQYTTYTEPVDWHIRLGSTPDGSDTLVRCPNHCEWTKMDTSSTGVPFALPGGEWIDAP